MVVRSRFDLAERFGRSFGLKLALALTLLSVTMTTGSLYFAYSHIRQLMLTQMRIRLQTAGRLSQSLFDPSAKASIQILRQKSQQAMLPITADLSNLKPGDAKLSLPPQTAERLMQTADFQRLVQLLRKTSEASRPELLPDQSNYPQPKFREANNPVSIFTYLLVPIPESPDYRITKFICSGFYETADDWPGNPIGNLFYSPDPVFAKVLQTKQPQFGERFFRDQWGSWLTFALPIKSDDGQVLAVLGMDYEASSEANQLQRLQYLYGGIIAASIGLSGLASYWLARWLGYPISLLHAAAQQVQRRNFSGTVEFQSRDELGLLAQAFNEMVREIQRYAASLETQNQQLEATVAERTAQLAQTNAALQKRQDSMAALLEALRLSELKYRKIFENSQVGIGRMDEAGLLLDINPHLSELLGVAAPDPGDQVSFVQFCREPEEFQRLLLTLPQQGSLSNMEIALCRTDGSSFWGLLSMQRNLEAACTEFFLADITDRKQAEAALRESEERLRLALMAANQGMYDLNLKTGQTIVSSEYASMLGYDPAIFQEANAKWFERLHPDDREQTIHAYRAYVAGEIPEYKIEFRQQMKNGGWKWILSLGKIVTWDETGQPLRMLGTYTDIDERKHMEEELRQINLELENRVDERTQDLRQAMEAAEAANHAKTVFLANMSHELRTPLNAILGFSQLLNRRSDLSPDQQQQVGIINRSGAHLLNLINDVLEMSKIEAGRALLIVKNFDLRELLNGLDDLFRLKAESKGLELMIEIADTVPPYIQTDEDKLRQVLANLLSNAIKFTQAGSVTLTIQVRPEEPRDQLRDQLRGETGDETGDELGISASPQPPITLYFEVKDTGPGIESTEQAVLFEPFVQTKAGQQSHEGTGLGLPISRQFVRLMGGDLICQSIEHQGATFWFQIPVVPVAIEALPAQKRTRKVIALAPDQPRYRVLVVEDQPENRLFLVQLLESVGFEVQQATNGQEAIAQFQEWHPDLIWMDMRMPVLDGYEATRQIRTSSAPATAPKIIALTASAFEDERAAILTAGCDDLFFKPATEAVLFEKMSQHIGVRYLYEEPAERSEP